MAIREQFTDDEWFLLLSTPAMVGATVASAGKSGPFGTAKEAVASLTTAATASKDYPNNELIQELTKRIEDREEAKAQVEAYREKAMAKLKGKDPTALRAETLEDARKTSALLSAKATPEQARDYKNWAMKVAENVANAAKEGGFMGFGGEQVSEEERAVISEIDSALAV